MTLICITTYNHSALVKAFIWDYILFVQCHENFDFVLSLDGSDKETIKYCERFGIPLIYSEKNEGVGISKNRVIETLSGYDNYFFIEDDVELLNPEVFDIHIDLSKKLDIHHFSLYPAWRSMEQVGELTTNNYHIIQTMYGSAQVNFFTRQGLDKVGGFHPMFAQYKRFGHTEHTYRFYHAGLSKYPFHIIKECIEGYFI